MVSFLVHTFCTRCTRLPHCVCLWITPHSRHAHLTLASLDRFLVFCTIAHGFWMDLRSDHHSLGSRIVYTRTSFYTARSVFFAHVWITASRLSSFVALDPAARTHAHTYCVYGLRRFCVCVSLSLVHASLHAHYSGSRTGLHAAFCALAPFCTHLDPAWSLVLSRTRHASHSRIVAHTLVPHLSFSRTFASARSRWMDPGSRLDRTFWSGFLRSLHPGSRTCLDLIFSSAHSRSFWICVCVLPRTLSHHLTRLARLPRFLSASFAGFRFALADADRITLRIVTHLPLAVHSDRLWFAFSGSHGSWSFTGWFYLDLRTLGSLSDRILFSQFTFCSPFFCVYCVYAAFYYARSLLRITFLVHWSAFALSRCTFAFLDLFVWICTLDHVYAFALRSFALFCTLSARTASSLHGSFARIALTHAHSFAHLVHVCTLCVLPRFLVSSAVMVLLHVRSHGCVRGSPRGLDGCALIITWMDHGLVFYRHGCSPRFHWITGYGLWITGHFALTRLF